MDTLKIDKSKAKRLYNTASTELKEMFEDTFGKEFFSEKITDRLKTFDDCCMEIGTSEDEFNKKFASLGLDIDTIFYEKCKIICKALNEGWKPNYKDGSEAKYHSWFAASGGGFSFDDCSCTITVTDVGSRLCVKSRELAEYIGKQFLSEYKSFLM